MRRCLLLLSVAFAPASVFAETVTTPARVNAVTLFPRGAEVARRVPLDLPAGVHTVIVPGLPEATDAGRLRIAAPEGVRLGAVSLALSRQPAADAPERSEVTAARAEVERLEQVVREGEREVALLRLDIEAADAQAQFLRNAGSDGAMPQDVAALAALSDAIASGILAARRASLTAAAQADAADRALEPDREALGRARQALAALYEETPSRTLTLTLTKDGDAPAELVVRTAVDEAGWRPVYDLRLDRGAAPALVADRGVVVEQASGEDWLGAHLTLSTARPSERSTPATLPPEQRWIVDAESRRDRAAAAGLPAPAPAYAMDAMVEAEAGGAEAAMLGATVTYVYPAPVDLRTGADALRLSLDRVALAPEIRAVAVPRLDETAFLVATATNATDEVLLPGPAQLWLDGALVGGTSLPLLAAGQKTDIGFGAIDGMRLKRTVANRSQGDTGVLRRSTTLEESATLEVENLTGEDWPVRLIDRVPYSEQETLKITWTAIPAPSVTDLDGGRGVLAWDFTLPAGGTQTVTLDTRMKWPDGFVLD